MAKPTTKKSKERKFKKVLKEAKAGTLRTSAGTKPKSKAQTLAIAFSKANIKRAKK